MKIVVAYIFPTLNMPVYLPLAERFALTYQEYPGNYPHQLTVLVNGPLYKGIEKAFDPIPCQFVQHNNSAKDLGAYLTVAKTMTCDLLVCLGAPVRFHKAGWLDRIVECFMDNGPGIYGACAMREPMPHIRTTSFWAPPQLLNAYPYGVSDRYAFEHGPNNITLWASNMGFPTLLVTWKGAFDIDQWNQPSNEDVLLLSQDTDRLNYT